MGSHQRESKASSQMTRKQLEDYVVGVVDHRIATVEERVAELERAIHSPPLPSGGSIEARTNNDAV